MVKLLELPEGTSLGCDPSGNMDIEVFHPDIPKDAKNVLPTWVKEGDTMKFLGFKVID
jgi:hypothetical protein